MCSSWQRDPAQYAQWILRTIVKKDIYRLYFRENLEKRLTGAARHLGFFSHIKKYFHLTEVTILGETDAYRY